MKATYVPPVRTPATPAEVSRAYTEALIEITTVMPKPEAVAVFHAQCELETGKMASCFNNAVGNIKCGSEYVGYFTCYRCNERLKQADGSYAYKWFSPEGPEEPKGNVIRKYTVPDGEPQTRFRAFKTLRDGVLDKIKFLSKPHWQPALQIGMTGDAYGYAKRVRELGYYTAPLEPYARAVVQLAARLVAVARGVAEAPDEPDEQTCGDMAECMRVPLPDWLLERVSQMQALTASQMLDDALDASRRDRNAEITGNDPHERDTLPPEGEA